MGKVNLNKKNKSEKDAVFKKRKAALGRGKHQHLSHTKIDLETATLRVPTQNKIEHVDRESHGPTIQQLQDLITLCHSDNEKKVKNGLSGLISFLPRCQELFLPKISEVLAATLHHLRHPMPQIRECAQNLISWIFGRYANQCSPFIPVFIRHIGAAVSSQSHIIKLQSAFLLDKVALLPNLQPLPSIFQLFPLMINASANADEFSNYTKTITKVLVRFNVKDSSNDIHDFKEFIFPKLFQENNATYSQRFRQQCILGNSEMNSIQELLKALVNCFNLISGDSESVAVSDLCKLLHTLYGLQSDIDLSTFFEFISSHFPYEEGTIKTNVIIAKFLSLDKKYYPKITEFLESVQPSSDNIVLFATVGNFVSDIPDFAECVPELCTANISDEAAPAVADSILMSILHEEKITKRSIRALISLKKGEDFQNHLIEVLKARLLTCSTSVRNLFLTLISSSAPLNRGFLKEFSIFISNEEKVDIDLCKMCIDSVVITNFNTDYTNLLCFLMTVGSRRASIRDHAQRHISRLRILSDEVSRPLFDRLDLRRWVIV